MTNLFLIFVTVVLAIVRFAITPRLDLPTLEGSYEAFAHLFVGGLIGAWAARRRGYTSEPLWGWLAVAISLLELVMFLIQKFTW